MRSFWQRESAGRFPRAEGALTTDIAIIGGGYTGVWLSYFLRSLGLKVILVEAETLAYGASGRNGGLLLQGAAQLLSQTALAIGSEYAYQLLDRTREAIQEVRGLTSASASIDFQITGSFYLAGDHEERPIVEETVRLMQEHGLAARVVPRAEQPRSLLPLNLDLGAYFPDDAMIHPVKLIAHLLEASRKGGVSIFQDSRVLQVNESSSQVTLTGDGFSIIADRVVLATNAYTNALTPHLSHLLTPIRGQMMATAPIPPLDYIFPVYADHGFNYWHRRQDGRLIVGGFRHLAMEDEVGTELTLHPEIQFALETLADAVAGHPVEVTDQWSGIMCSTPDHFPLVGPLSDRILIGAGYNGHGSTVTPIVARMLADYVTSGTTIFPPFDVQRVL